jgi:hypothetical protein
MVKYKVQSRVERGGKVITDWSDYKRDVTVYDTLEEAEKLLRPLNEQARRREGAVMQWSYRIVEFEYTERVVPTPEEKERTVVGRIEEALSERRRQLEKMDDAREQALEWFELHAAKGIRTKMNAVEAEIKLLEEMLG